MSSLKWTLQIDEKKYFKYVSAIEDKYLDNPYHNR